MVSFRFIENIFGLVDLREAVKISQQYVDIV